MRSFEPPDPGDIVYCRFPESGMPGPGPKPRPALVLRVGLVNEETHVRIAYGTSKKTGDLRTGEFLIAPADAAAFSVSGLAYATKFDLTGSVELPYNDSRQNAYFFPKRIDEIFQLLIAGGLVLEEFRLMTDHARDAVACIAAGNDVAL